MTPEQKRMEALEEMLRWIIAVAEHDNGLHSQFVLKRIAEEAGKALEQ